MGKRWQTKFICNKNIILDELAKVIEPELGLSIVDLDLIDNIDINGETLNVSFHLRMPNYPTALALFIASDIKERLVLLPGVFKVVVELNNHAMSAQINRDINEAA